MKFQKCHVKCCGRDQFPNQLIEVPTSTITYFICPQCMDEINELIGNKQFTASLYKGSAMSLGEIERLRGERREDYAMNDFNF